MLVEVLAVSGIANRSDTITATRQTVHAVFNFICADVGNDYPTHKIIGVHTVYTMPAGRSI